MTGADERPAEDAIQLLAQSARARAATAPRPDEIRTMADHAIEQINTLADRAISQARQVDELMQRLNELLEGADETP